MKKLKLNDLAVISTGHTFKGKAESSNDSGTRVIQIKDIKEGYFFNSKLPLANEESGKIKIRIKENDLLIPLKGIRNSVMLISQINSAHITTASNQVAIMSISNDNIMPEYLLWYLNSILGQTQLSSLKIGSTIPHLSITDLRNLDIPIPDMKDQKSISSLYRNWLKQLRVLEEMSVNGTNLVNEACLSFLMGKLNERT